MSRARCGDCAWLHKCREAEGGLSLKPAEERRKEGEVGEGWRKRKESAGGDITSTPMAKTETDGAQWVSVKWRNLAATMNGIWRPELGMEGRTGEERGWRSFGCKAKALSLPWCYVPIRCWT